MSITARRHSGQSSRVQTGGGRRIARMAATAAMCGMLAVGGLTGAATPASAAAPSLPNGFQLPFPCGQTWAGQTRTDHSPRYAVDFNRANDFGDTVVAAAAGTVSRVENLGSKSYGKFVVITHAGGWTTYYAHLSVQSVKKGQRVAAGTKIGEVGSTGGSTGPHLHFEERLNGAYRKVVLDGHQALYFGTKNYSSHNACGAGSGHPGTVNTAGTPLTVRSGPGTKYHNVGQLADGTKVSISCQASGEAVKGTYGTSKIWDKIGKDRFVSDAYVSTGSDGRVAKKC